MALPEIITPTFTIVIPGIKKPVKYRPFLVKEEKLLILASESETLSERVSACSQVVENCTFGLYNDKNLTMYQLQYLFLKIKAKSVGTIQEFNLTCGSCSSSMRYEMNIEDYKIYGEVDTTKKEFKINDEVSLVIRYPTAEYQGKVDILTDTEIVINCIDHIVNGEEVIDPKDETLGNMLAFIENLPIKLMQDIGEFLTTIPVLGHEISFTCKTCGKDNYVGINGYEHFFG